MKYLHEHDIVHCDLKSVICRYLPSQHLTYFCRPENILYRTKDPGSNIVIADFSMYVEGTHQCLSQLTFNLSSAKHLHSSEEQLHSLAGSIGYVAPEVLNKNRHGKAVDIWATGCILHITEMCSN